MKTFFFLLPELRTVAYPLREYCEGKGNKEAKKTVLGKVLKYLGSDHVR